MQYGREDLVFEDRHLGVRADQCRLDIATAKMISAVDYFSALLAYAPQSFHHPFHSSPIDQRTHQRLWIEWVADLDLFVCSDEAIGQILRNVALKKQASDAGTSLACRSHCAEQHCSNDHLKVRVIHDDDT